MKTNSVRIELDNVAAEEIEKEFLKGNCKSLSLSSISAKQNKRNLLKYGSLITLLFQNAALNITMRMARTQKELFISSTAVIMGELLKLITCLVMIRFDEGRSQFDVMITRWTGV